MTIVVAPDSFKDCLSATKVARAIADGIKHIVPEMEIISLPMADGGEGTVEALIAATGGKIISIPSVDALNRPIQSFYGVLGDGKTAIIEMAAASGIEYLLPHERNPLLTSTYGTGLLIKAALDAGFTSIVVGIGGSATNDGGAGMAQALGFGLLDKTGNPIGLGGGNLRYLKSIDKIKAHPALNKARITIACDVTNPLLGQMGATRVYGPQKGASPEMLEILESNMTHYSSILEREFSASFAHVPGSGAAGGLGAGLLAFCSAQLVSGFGFISKLTHLENHISRASLVFTGEGKVDQQTASGKTIGGIARLAKKYNVPVVALAGMVTATNSELEEQGVTATFEIGNQVVSAEESIARAEELLRLTVEQIMQMIVNKPGLGEKQLSERKLSSPAKNKLRQVLLNYKNK